MRSCHTFRRFRAGFSLIEALVVTGVIAVVAMLLFPVLDASRSAALKIKCTGNLKQIGTAVAAYMADHNGEYPPTRLQHYANPKTGVKTPVPEIYLQLKDYLTVSAVQPKQYSQAGAWWCPADRERPVNLARDSYGMVMMFGGNKAMTINWNGTANNDYDPRYRYPRRAEKPLSELIYMVDFLKVGSGRLSGTVDAGAWPFKKGSSAAGPTPAEVNRLDFPRHGKIVNALFLDGGVRALQVHDLLGTGNRHLDPTLE
ncbi:MAG TPA: hypothetical protein VNQ90_16885 [Chthoniobacteraceae bacterium]|nr:hypothetical protein [Chthoniobacteraceae bacterium]